MIKLYKKTVNVNIFRNNEFSGLNFGYVMTIMSINFLRNQWVSSKVMAKLV